MSLTLIQPSKHLVKDTPVARLFRRRLRFDDIMTFWNAETGQWILAYWIHRRRGLVEELEDLGVMFECVTPQFVKMIVDCWKPVDWRLKKKRLISKERDRVRRETEDLQEQQRRWDWSKKRMQERAPVPYAFKTPISGGNVQ